MNFFPPEEADTTMTFTVTVKTYGDGGAKHRARIRAEIARRLKQSFEAGAVEVKSVNR